MFFLPPGEEMLHVRLLMQSDLNRSEAVKHDALAGRVSDPSALQLATYTGRGERQHGAFKNGGS